MTYYITYYVSSGYELDIIFLYIIQWFDNTGTRSFNEAKKSLSCYFCLNVIRTEFENIQ